MLSVPSTQFLQRSSFRLRIVAQFAVIALVLGLYPVFAQAGVGATLAGASAIGVSSSILQSSVFAFASLFPIKYASRFYTAQAWAGILASVVRIITNVAMPGNLNGSALLFFIFAAVVQVACIAGYEYVVRQPITLALARRSEQAAAALGLSTKDIHPDDEEEGGGLLGESRDDSDRELHDHSLRGHRALSLRELAAVFCAAAVANETIDPTVKKPPPVVVAGGKVAKDVWLFGRGALDGFNVFFVFVVTFITFPGVILEIKYNNTFGTWLDNGQVWGGWGTGLLLLFNIGDVSGRYTGECTSRLLGRWYTLVNLARIATVVLFVLCKGTLTGATSDVLTVITMCVMSFTNGWCSAVAFGSAPSRVDADYIPQIGSLMGSLLVYGIGLGSVISIFSVHW
jgi:hypothetical protein